jgi:pimeloyl-ACP methyl ester carboxylesterase
MPFARNAVDDARTYVEDDGGPGTPVVFHGGFGEPVGLVRSSALARALPRDEFRHIYVDHRGHGRSDKPHNAEDYSIALRVGDAVSVLDELGIEGAHFVGMSWGGRLGFGIGEHAPERVLSLVIGGQQPYRWPDSPLVRVVTEGLAAARRAGSMQPLVEAFEDFWNVTFPEERQRHVLDNDPAALDAAWRSALDEGPISDDLSSWRVPCLIFIGESDLDFAAQAERAAEEIPGAEFMSMVERDHYRAHTQQLDEVVEAVLRLLRANS